MPGQPHTPYRAVTDDEPIAIVGIGLRLPGESNSPDEFDAFLRAGRSGIRTIPEDRWDVQALQATEPDEKGKIVTTSGGFLDRIDQFDAPFFNISPKEARYIDPQQRIVLETAWKALEHAGIDPAPLRHGSGGVFMGVSSFDYGLRMGELPYEELDGHLAAGSPIFAIAGRVSYFLGWRGPSICVDSACSSSLSALHLAVSALRSGECQIALAGGVNAVHHPSFMVMFSHGQMLAADGRCKTFDESADGYSRAEGCGVLVLKRLKDAQRDGDTVIALIRGTAIGQDGDSAGLTVPHGPAQELTIRKALDAAGLKPTDIQYVEAHGTGTPLGDPIELGAISNVFADSHTKQNPLIVGSAKTNIGHMEPASGIVGVIKTALQLRSSTIYPHLNFTEPSHRIPWDAYPVRVPTACEPWNAPVRRAVVNSFGFAGTIAAAVLEQAPAPQTVPSRPDTALDAAVFTLSGKNAAGLKRQIESYQAFLEGQPDPDIARLCYTANAGRSHFSHRLAGVVRTRADLVKLLDGAARDEERPAAANLRKVAFLFSGQGTQYSGMGADLYRNFPVFRRHLDDCNRLFAAHLDQSVRDLVLGTADEPELLDRTGYTQPALFAFEYSLAQLWLSWGVQPSVLIGHSIGEVTAAAVAGLFSLEDAVTLVAVRARLMQSVRRAGGMAAVALPREETEALLTDYPELAMAAVNAPDQCVVSGAETQLNDLVARLKADGVRVDRLTVSHAFHSPLMEEVFEEFRAALSHITFQRPEFPIISNITGTLARFTDISTPDYWVRHIGAPVLFKDGIRAVEARGRHAFVEIGPSTALTALAQRCVTPGDHHWVASARRRDPRGDTVLRGLADLYTAGISVSWAGFHGDQVLPKMNLPTYSFERKRYWLPTGAVGAADTGTLLHGDGTHPLLGRARTDESTDGSRTFVARYTAGQPALLHGYTTDAVPTVPPSAYVEMILALQDAVYGATSRPVLDLTVETPLTLPHEDGPAIEVRTRLRPLPTGAAHVEIVSGPETDQVVHATAMLAAEADPVSPDETLMALADDPGPLLETVSGDAATTDLSSVGHHLAPRYRLLAEAARHADGIIVAALDNREAAAGEHLPAEVLQSALHALAALDDDTPALVPTRIGKVRLFRKPRSARVHLVAKQTTVGPAERRVDLLLLDAGQPVAEALDVTLAVPGPRDEHPQFLHRLHWLRRSAVPQAQPTERHVLMLGAAAEAKAGTHLQPGVRTTTLPGTGELAAALTDPSVTDVCWFWQVTDEPMSVHRLRGESERNYRDLLDVIATLNHAGASVAPRLWLVTRRAQWLPGDTPDSGEQLPAATLWGFGHTLLNEFPRYRTTLVDLPNGPESAALATLALELAAHDTGDFQVAHRDGHRYVRRILPGRTTPSWEGGYELLAPEAEQTEVRPTPASDRDPGPGELLIQVHTSTAHWADPKAQVLGLGCSGTVIAAGPGTQAAVGDQVVAYRSGTMRRTVTIHEDLVAPLPDGLDPAVAATIPAAYLTAHQALSQVTDIEPGAAVLVHTPGATGLALAALATAAGFEVIATAEGQQHTQLLSAGVKHVLDQRGSDMATEILEHTAGRGAAVLFEAPTYHAAPVASECLAPSGRRIDVLPLVDEFSSEDARAIARELLTTTLASVASGRLPVPAVDAFGIDEADEALAAAQRGTGAEPVVTLHRGPDSAEASLSEVLVRPDRSYLVTGGLGGLGLVTARKLVDLGAQHLVLVSRSGRPTPEAAGILVNLGSRCEITLEQADLGDPDDVGELFSRLRALRLPLGGIVHAAGRAGSSLISNLTWEAIDEQLHAQAYGGWLLHQASLDLPELDFFVVHSSIAAVVGGATQAHYAAAFAFLDSLVQQRRRQDLPALAVNWGMWSQVGMSARLEENLARELERGGLRFFSPARALRTLHRLLTERSEPLVAGEWEWNRYVSLNPLRNALYARLVKDLDAPQPAPRSGGGPSIDLAGLLAKPEAERRVAVAAVVMAAVAAVLHVDEDEEVDPSTEFVALGLDSLMALELKTGLEALFRIALPASLTFDHPSPQQLVTFVDAQLTPQAG